MIRDNVKKILAGLPPGVELVAAAKTRTPGEVLQAIDAGVRIIGENYVQEAQSAHEAVGARAQWHCIGHLQTNKVKTAVGIFDMIETVDSLRLATEIDKASAAAGKAMSVLIEINSGREPNKSGVMPEDAQALAAGVAALKNVRVMGLMTMGVLSGTQEDYRPFFRRTKKVFGELKAANIPNVEMRYLSMGMTDSFRVAIEEGANLVRIGTLIFGARK